MINYFRYIDRDTSTDVYIQDAVYFDGPCPPHSSPQNVQDGWTPNPENIPTRFERWEPAVGDYVRCIHDPDHIMYFLNLKKEQEIYDTLGVRMIVPGFLGTKVVADAERPNEANQGVVFLDGCGWIPVFHKAPKFMGAKSGCQHVYVNVSFSQIVMACKFCGEAEKE